MVTTRADFWAGRTARARPYKSPPRELPRTERGGAAVLFAAPAGVHDHGRRCGRLARACRVRARLQRLDRRHGADPGGRLVRAGGPGCCSTRAPGKRFREFRESPRRSSSTWPAGASGPAISPNKRLQLIVDELRDRPAVRAGQMRASRSTATSRAGRGLADRDRRSRRLRGRQAVRPRRSRRRERGRRLHRLAARRAFDGAQLEEAKAGILAGAVGAAAVTLLVVRLIGRLAATPPRRL